MNCLYLDEKDLCFRGVAGYLREFRNLYYSLFYILTKFSLKDQSIKFYGIADSFVIIYSQKSRFIFSRKYKLFSR